MSKTMSKTTTKKERCCFAGCRTLIRDYGNNPRPCYTSGRCCDHCNIKVIEERWNAIQKSIASPPHIMVHVDGNSVQNVDDTFFDPLDELWERVPGAHAAGIPLYAQKLPLSSSTARGASMYVAVRLMSELDSGLAPARWQYGGANGDCPPVILARSDGMAFTVNDWGCLDGYLSKRFDEGGFAVTPADFEAYKAERG